MAREILALVLLAYLPACASFHAAEHEVQLAYLPEKDELRCVEVQRGLSATGLGTAVEALAQFLTHRRAYPPEGGLLAIDFDEETSAPASDGGLNANAFLAVAAQVHVEDARLFLDQEQVPGAVRRTRVEHLTRVFELVNAWINRDALAEPVWSRPFEPGFPFFSAEARETFRSALERGHAWIRTQGSTIVVDLPMSGRNAATCLDWLMTPARAAKDDKVRFLYAASSIEIANGRVLLTFCGPELAQPCFPWRETEFKPSPALRDELSARGTKWDDDSVLARAREWLTSSATAPTTPADKANK